LPVHCRLKKAAKKPRGKKNEQSSGGLVAMRDAASDIRRFVEWLVRGVITPNEFGAQAIDTMLHDEACDPAAIFRTLPERARAAVLEQASRFAERGLSR
jgi:hypothetical protein